MKQLIVQSEEPVRLDRYLRRDYPNFTQGMIEQSLRKGNIKLNGNKSRAGMRVVHGDIITVALGAFTDAVVENTEDNARPFAQNVIALACKLLSEYILFSSEEFIAIDKPTGLAVQGGSKISLSINDALRYINYIESTEYKLVHRLDKETSGVLLIAKGFNSAAKFGRALRDKLIGKTYIAVLSGCPAELEGTLVHRIGKDRSGVFEVVKELSVSGVVARTHYKVLQSTNDLSLVKFKPETGRMHQLRFHSQYLGCPIVGDNKYGGKKHNRMLLHAQNIVIPRSIFGKEIAVKSELPDEFYLKGQKS